MFVALCRVQRYYATRLISRSYYGFENIVRYVFHGAVGILLITLGTNICKESNVTPNTVNRSSILRSVLATYSA